MFGNLRINTSYFFAFSVILLLVIPHLVQRDMFMDGLVYATLGENLSEGVGSFWQPHLTGDFYSPFHEHPPLVFGVESVLFKALGQGFLTERIFSFLLLLISTIGIIKLWRLVSDSSNAKLGWIPVIFWIITPHVFWSFHHNMLENALTVCTVFAVYHLIILCREESWIQIIKRGAFASLLLLAAFLSKGFVGLFPLAVPFFWFILKPSKKIVSAYAVFLAITAMVFSFLFIYEPARESIGTYIDTQVAGSLKGERVVVRRTKVIEQLILDLLPAIGLSLITFFAFRNKKEKTDQSMTVFMVLIGLSAVLPMMISPKQLSFYIVPSIPFFAIAITLYFQNSLSVLHDRFHNSQIQKWLTGVILVGALTWGAVNFGTFARNKDMMTDLETISSYTGTHQKYGIHKSLHQSWSLFAYLQRYYDTDIYRNYSTESFIISSDSTTTLEGYDYVQLNTKEIFLFEKQ